MYRACTEQAKELAKLGVSELLPEPAKGLAGVLQAGTKALLPNVNIPYLGRLGG